MRGLWSQFIQITQSRVLIDSDTSQLKEEDKTVECTLCGNTGEIEIWRENGEWNYDITGEIEATDDVPRDNP